MNPTDLDDTLRAQTSASTGQLLLRAARLLDERALARLAAIPGAPPVRPAHTRLFPHLSFTGVRATTLAKRLGVTKQAVAPLLAELVAWGLVEQVPDPADRRATLVRFTHDGLAALTPKGILAVWSAADDRAFTRRIERAGFDVEPVEVRARGKKGGHRHVIWLGVKRG